MPPFSEKKQGIVDTNSCDDGDGVKKRTTDRPLTFDVIHFFAVVSLHFGGLDHLGFKCCKAVQGMKIDYGRKTTFVISRS